MNSIIEELTKWNCDIEGALARFCNNEDMYLGYLKEYQSVLDSAKLIQLSNDRQGLIDYVHMVKGAMGNLGIQPIFQLCNDFLVELRNNEMDHLKERLEEFHKLIERYHFIMSR